MEATLKQGAVGKKHFNKSDMINNYKRIVGIKNYLRMLIALVIGFSACKNGDNSHTASNATAQAEGKNNAIQFTLRLTPGAKYYYTTTTETTTKLEVDGKKIKTENNATIGLLYEVLQAAADSMVVKITYDKIHIELTDNDDKQVMDAGNTGDEQSAMDKLLGMVKGSSVIITLNKKGQVIKTSGGKEITGKALASLGIYDNEQTKKTVKAQIGKLTGDDFIENNVSQGFNFYPDTSITEGQSWIKKNSSQGEIKFDAATKYTLSSIDDGIASITIESQLANTGTNKPINIMGQQVEADLSQKTTGDFETDISTGMLTRGKTKSIMEGTIQVMAKLVPVEIKIIREMTIKKI